MPDRRDTQVLQVFHRELRQHIGVDGVFAKRGLYCSRPRLFNQASMSTARLAVPHVANLTPVQPGWARSEMNALRRSATEAPRMSGTGPSRHFAALQN